MPSIICFVLVPIVLIPLLAVLPKLPVPRLSPLLLGGVCFIPGVLMMLRYARDRQDVRRRLQDYGRFMCLKCRYPLHGLEDSGTCPECRQTYVRARIEKAWLTWEETNNKERPMIPVGYRGSMVGPDGQLLSTPRRGIDAPLFLPRMWPVLGGRGLWILLPLIMIGMAALLLVSHRSFKSPFLYILCVPMWSLSLIGIFAIMQSRLKSRAKKLGFLACLSCMKDLREQPAAGRCPSCDQTYEHALTRAVWERL